MIKRKLNSTCFGVIVTTIIFISVWVSGLSEPDTAYAYALSDTEYQQIAGSSTSDNWPSMYINLPDTPRYCYQHATEEGVVINEVMEEDRPLVDSGCYPSMEKLIDALNKRYGRNLSIGDLLMLESENGTRSVMHTPIIGFDYNYTGYGGSVTYFTTSNPAGCFGGATFYAPSVPNNNWAESGKGASGCNTQRRYEFNNFGGASLQFTGSQSNYGVLRNNVSSAQFAP